MFYQLKLRHQVVLHPRHFGPGIMKVVKKRLYSEVEGSCTEKYGQVIAITDIDDISTGMLDANCQGHAVFNVAYTALVFKPFKSEVMDGVVSRITKLGIFVDIGPMSSCFVSRHSMFDMKHDPDVNPPCYRSSRDDITIQQGAEVRVRLFGYQIDTKHINAVGGIADHYLGYIESGHFQQQG